MDKDKLVECLIDDFRVYESLRYTARTSDMSYLYTKMSNYIGDLRFKIKNGEFKKEPCEHCISGHYRDLKGTSYSADLYPYCPNCGRDLEGRK